LGRRFPGREDPLIVNPPETRASEVHPGAAAERNQPVGVAGSSPLSGRLFFGLC